MKQLHKSNTIHNNSAGGILKEVLQKLVSEDILLPCPRGIKNAARSTCLFIKRLPLEDNTDAQHEFALLLSDYIVDGKSITLDTYRKSCEVISVDAIGVVQDDVYNILGRSEYNQCNLSPLISLPKTASEKQLRLDSLERNQDFGKCLSNTVEAADNLLRRSFRRREPDRLRWQCWSPSIWRSFLYSFIHTTSLLYPLLRPHRITWSFGARSNVLFRFCISTEWSGDCWTCALRSMSGFFPWDRLRINCDTDARGLWSHCGAQLRTDCGESVHICVTIVSMRTFDHKCVQRNSPTTIRSSFSLRLPFSHF